MQEPLFDIFGTKHREATLVNRQATENLNAVSNVLDLKAGALKGTQKKALVDVKNRLALAPVTDTRAGPLKPNTLSAPVFSKTKSTDTPFKSPAVKPIAKKEPTKPHSSVPFTSMENASEIQVGLPDVFNVVSDMGGLPFEEDDYEDLMPKSERFTTEQIHKLVNYWELTRPPLSSSSPPRGPIALNVSAPDVEVPDISMLSVPTIKVQPVPLPSFQIWEDDME